MGHLDVYGVKTEIENLWSMLRQQQGPQRVAALTYWTHGSDLEPILAEASAIGLMRQLPTGEWQALPVADAIAAAREWHRRRAAESDEALLRADETGADRWLRTLVGIDDIRAYIDEACGRCTEVIRGFDVPPYGTPRNDPEEVSDPDKLVKKSPELEALYRGVRIETIYDPSALEHDVKRAEVNSFRQKGETARIGDVPMKMMLFDGREIMMSVRQTYKSRNPKHMQAVWTDHPSVVAVVNDMFESRWERAKPFPNGAHQDNVLAEVATCLYVTGLDVPETVQQLNLSVSTVRRYQTQIREILGAKTDRNAGYLLATRGLAGLRDLES